MKYQFKNAFDTIMIDQLAGIPEGAKILVYRLVFTAILLAEKYEVHFVTDDPEAKELFEHTVIGNGEFGCNDECIFIETSGINNKIDMGQWLEWSKEVDMDFSAMVINPPYSIGNKIISEVIKHLTDDGKAVVIQPLGQYKQQKLYEHIAKFELTDPKQFTDAVITENLNISVVTKGKQNKYNWQELVLESCDQNFRKFYDWNIAHDRGIVMKQMSYKKPADLDVYKDFWETCKCFSSLGGGGFGKNGGGYDWNVNYNNSSVNAGIGCISFASKREKDNFCKWWYKDSKGKALASQMALGVHMGGSVGPNTAIALPQIDWETIDQHPLWNIDVDAAVLDTMGLKWNNDKTKIIEK